MAKRSAQVDSGANMKSEKTTDTQRRVVIGSGFDTNEMLRLDSEGVVLLFEQKEDFLPLDDEIVKQLSQVNRYLYHAAKQFHEAYRGQDHDDFVKSFQINQQYSGTPREQLRFKKDPRKYARWTRPDKVAARLAKGYRIVEKDEYNTFLGPQNGRHEIAKLGKTELVLMAQPIELRREHEKLVQEKTARETGRWKEDALREMARDGGKPFVAKANDDGRWQEIEDAPEPTQDS